MNETSRAAWLDAFATEFGRHWPCTPDEAYGVADGALEDWDGLMTPVEAARLEAQWWRDQGAP